MLTGRAAVPVPGVVFRDAWEVAGAGPGATVSNDNPFSRGNLDLDRRIDHVMVGVPKLGGAGHVTNVELVGNEPVNGMFGSDHYGVAADLRY